MYKPPPLHTHPTFTHHTPSPSHTCTHIVQDFRREVESRESLFHAMMLESEVWADHLVPDECHSDLPSPSEESGMSHDVISYQTLCNSPDLWYLNVPCSLLTGEEATDFPFDVQLPFIKNRMKMAEKKWSNVKQLLRERENQLELSLGTTVVFLQTVAELLTWLAEKLQLEAISATPPASVESLRGFVEIVEVMCVWGVGGWGPSIEQG